MIVFFSKHISVIYALKKVTHVHLVVGGGKPFCSEAEPECNRNIWCEFEYNLMAFSYEHHSFLFVFYLATQGRGLTPKCPFSLDSLLPSRVRRAELLVGVQGGEALLKLSLFKRVK